VANYVLARRILSLHGLSYRKYPIAVALLRRLYGSSVTTAEDGQWRRYRAAMKQIFSNNRGRHFQGIALDHAERLAPDWQQRFAQPGGSGGIDIYAESVCGRRPASVPNCWRSWVANCYSGRERGREQATTTGPASAVIERRRGRAGGSVELCGWVAAERAMNPAAVVIILEQNQLSGQACHVPEEHRLKDLTPGRALQPLDERMRNRCLRISATSPPR
jgi:hypothetical protein